MMELEMGKDNALGMGNRMAVAWGIPLASLLLVGQFPEYKEWMKNYN
jgi:hypothetical protein